ncbi:hypothetical protein JCM14469_02450 [Desulfatiferula olefinivorans]
MARYTDRIIEIPQWGSDAAWAEANGSIEHLIRMHGERLGDARETAARIRSRLVGLFPLLDEFCRGTCVDCSSPCCVTATVWLDFRDLLFIHLSGQTVPPHQLIEKQPDSCRYSSDTGCTLPRLSRPWVCTHYLCPLQKALLRKKSPSERAAFENAMEAIRDDRVLLENQFLSATR